MLQPGFYKGRILDYGIKLTSKGDPAPTIAFIAKDASGQENKVFWQGSWNGKAMDFTMEALLVCGLKNPKKFIQIADGKASGILDLEAEFELEIDVEVNQNDPDKKHNKVKWINASGSSKFANAITSQQFASLANQQNLVTEFLRVAQEKGYQTSSSPVTSFDRPPF
jgi:hypothetical protein